MRINVGRSLDLAPHSEFRAPSLDKLRAPSSNRNGFTLVELLVAAALSLAIMGIISVAFQKSIDTFRLLRSVSQMQERLKSAHMVLKRDLEADHFDDSSNNFHQLSQIRLDKNRWNMTNPVGQPIYGFFSIMQGPNPSNGNQPFISEGSDADNLLSTRALTHSLHFTAKLNFDRVVTTTYHEEDFFYAQGPNGAGGSPNLLGRCPRDFARSVNNATGAPIGNTFASRWAEVMYFLAPNGSTANGEPLFALYRRQRLLLDPPFGFVPQGGTSNTPAPDVAVPWNAAVWEQTYPDISWGPNAQTTPGPLAGPRVNRKDDVWVRANRISPAAINFGVGSPLFASPQPNNNGNVWRSQTIGELTTNGPMTGDDILLADVLSFEVKANWTASVWNPVSNPNGASLAFEQPRAFGASPLGNPDWPYDYLPVPLVGLNPRNPTQYNDVIYPVRTFDTWSGQAGTSSVSTTDGGAQWNALTNPTGVDWNNPFNTGHGFNESGVDLPDHRRPPLRIRINSLQIRIRVWDEAGQTARQITIIQDM